MHFSYDLLDPVRIYIYTYINTHRYTTSTWHLLNKSWREWRISNCPDSFINYPLPAHGQREREGGRRGGGDIGKFSRARHRLSDKHNKRRWQRCTMNGSASAPLLNMQSSVRARYSRYGISLESYFCELLSCAVRADIFQLDDRVSHPRAFFIRSVSPLRVSSTLSFFFFSSTGEAPFLRDGGCH